ncbi:MAG: hypothetical protein ACYTFT_08530 [Planctomycetota bacterium]
MTAQATGAKAPKISVSREAKRKLSVTARALADEYGPHIFPEDDPIDAMVFTLLAEHAPVTNVKKAIRRYRDLFADWNETRSATVRQLQQTLDETRFKNSGRAAHELKSLLQGMFDALYGFDVLQLKEMTADRRQKMLQAIRGVPSFIVEYLLLVAGLREAPPLAPATVRVLERVGVFKEGDSAAKQEKTLSSVVSGLDAMRLHHILAQHARKLCAPESPKCDRCRLQKECAAYKAFKNAPKAKKAAPKKKTASAKKKTASAKKKTASAKKKTASAKKKTASAKKKTASAKKATSKKKATKKTSAKKKKTAAPKKAAKRTKRKK